MKKKKEFFIVNNKKEKINIIWDEYFANEDDVSILQYIENNSAILKDKYVTLVERIGFLKIKKKKLIDIFSIKKNFSYWWITDIYEKSLYKHSSINEVIKLLAFECILKKRKVQKIVIQNFDPKLIQSIKAISEKMNITLEFKYKRYFYFNNILFFKIVFSFLNFLRFIYKRISLNKTNVQNKNIHKLFCSYFAYVDFEKLNKNIYHSDFWNGLTNKNNSIIKNSHFLHIFIPNKNISYNKSLKLFKEINKNSNNQHFFIEEFFSFKIFIKIMNFWISSIIKFRLNKKNIKCAFIKKISSWSFFEDEFVESFCGTSALVNMYYFFLFEELYKKMRSTKKTFFLYENQGWEKSFIFNLKKIKQNKIFGIQHSTVRFWDLRYTLNKSKDSVLNKFQPHYYCVNGKDSMKKFATAGYPLSKLKKVEAVRYSNILNRIYSKSSKNIFFSSILIVGDFSVESNLNISAAINGLCPKSYSNFKFTLKEHPLRKMSHLLNIRFSKSVETIENLRKEHVCAIVSNTTSAAVDLYLLGFKLVVIIDKKNVNLSPLKGRQDVIFLYDQSLLSNYLNKLLKNDIVTTNNANFFYHSSNLNLWNKLIN